MTKFFRKCSVVIGSIALATAPFSASAQDNSEMRPEVYRLLVDCGAANALAASGADEEAAAKEYERKAVAFWQVGMLYGSVDKEQMRVDGSAALDRVGTMVSADNEGLAELVIQCTGMEDVVMDIYDGND